MASAPRVAGTGWWHGLSFASTLRHATDVPLTAFAIVPHVYDEPATPLNARGGG